MGAALETAPAWPDLLAELRDSAEHRLWRSAVQQVAESPNLLPSGRRTVTVTILATHTVDFLAELLPVAGATVGIDLAIRRVDYGQLETELLDPASETRREPTDYVLLAGTHEDVELGAGTAAVDSAVQRWTTLWHHARGLGMRVVQCLFAIPADDAAGNCSWLESSAGSVIGRINSELIRHGDGVLFVDCDRLAAEYGRRRWRDPRYWETVRQPVALDALPLLAKTIAGVLANDLGLTRRCLVLDLDNTLWQGTLGEDTVAGVQVTDAFARFQDYVLGLRRRGMVLAVASKNDAELATQGLREVAGMRLRPADFAVVVADWRPKSEQLLDIADQLQLNLDSLAFVDDNPAECAQVAARLPQVDVIALPQRPAGYVQALAGRPTLELGAGALDRAASYSGLRQAAELRLGAESLDEFLAGLGMRARIQQVGAGLLDRAAQLVQKTNQLNLTTRRRNRDELAGLIDDPAWICLALSLTDRFADHGVTGLALVHCSDGVAEIDTLLLSCRIIGRTAERSLLAAVGHRARDAGCQVLRGTFVPTDRNAPAANIYPDSGFQLVSGSSSYEYPLDRAALSPSPHILEEQT